MTTPPKTPDELIEAAAEAAYRQGYADGFTDAKHPEGRDEEGDIWRDIDGVAVAEGFHNYWPSTEAREIAALFTSEGDGVEAATEEDLATLESYARDFERTREYREDAQAFRRIIDALSHLPSGGEGK